MKITFNIKKRMAFEDRPNATRPDMETSTGSGQRRSGFRGGIGRRSAGAVAALSAAVVSFIAPSARADCELGRPTEVGAYMSEGYEGREVRAWDTGNVRVLWVEEGPDAPDLTTTDPNVVPDYVVRAADVAEMSLEAFEGAGYRPVRRDDGPDACVDHGGDGRLDVYLVGFGAGDGQTVLDHCEEDGRSSTCAGFILLEARPTGYPSDDVALRTIVPHEVFHLVQHAYAEEVPSWFAEGTAQWATDRLDPSLEDLESYLPAFFELAERSIDNPPGGAAGAFLYGTAIWPIYLEERFDADVVRDILAALGGGASFWDAVDAALGLRDTATRDAMPLFSAYNTATGERTGVGGYAQASAYPMVELRPVTPSTDVIEADVLSGFASRHYRLTSVEGALEAFVEADTDRVEALLVPLEDGTARLNKVSPLPAVVEGDAIVVVAGRTPSKADAPFELRFRPAPSEGGGGQGVGGQGAPGGGSMGGGTDDDAAIESSGCDCNAAPNAAPDAGLRGAIPIAMLLMLVSARRRRRSSHQPGGSSGIGRIQRLAPHPSLSRARSTLGSTSGRDLRPFRATRAST